MHMQKDRKRNAQFTPTWSCDELEQKKHSSTVIFFFFAGGTLMSLSLTGTSDKSSWRWVYLCVSQTIWAAATATVAANECIWWDKHLLCTYDVRTYGMGCKCDSIQYQYPYLPSHSAPVQLCRFTQTMNYSDCIDTIAIGNWHSSSYSSYRNGAKPRPQSSPSHPFDVLKTAAYWLITSS